MFVLSKFSETTTAKKTYHIFDNLIVVPYLGCENGYSQYNFKARILQNLAGQKKPGLEAREDTIYLCKQHHRSQEAENIPFSGSL